MSGQMADVIVIDDVEYAVVEPEPGALFEPREHGLHPVMTHTANTRGVLARYRIDEGRVLLSDLQVGHVGAPPPLGTVEATTDEHERVWTYLDVDVPVRWTGDLIAGAEPILDLYVHSGFAPVWHYVRVLALDVEDGLVEGAEDRSAQVAAFREARTDDDQNAVARLLHAIRVRRPGGED